MLKFACNWATMSLYSTAPHLLPRCRNSAVDGIGESLACSQGRNVFFFYVTRSGRLWDYPAANVFGNVAETASIDLLMKGESVDLTRGDSNIFFRVKRRRVSDREQEGVLPRVPPASYVSWQHKRLKVLYLAVYEYQRVFLCNR